MLILDRLIDSHPIAFYSTATLSTPTAVFYVLFGGIKIK